MAKTHAPSEITIAGRTMKTNAMPDPFDALDLVYRPLLQLLPAEKDHRAGQPVLDQVGQSCTGHAVAALIDTVLSEPLSRAPAHGAPRTPTTQVSPYMLYAMARRYDEYPGDADVGSSLRGAFKGWYRHGVCSAETWPADVAGPRPLRPDVRRGVPQDAPRGLLPGQRPADRRHAIGDQRAQRDRRVGSDPRGMAGSRAAPPRARGLDLGDRAVAGAPGRSRVPDRRVQRRRLPRPELVGNRVGPQRLRDAAVRRLARQRLRRVGRPPRRPAGRGHAAPSGGRARGNEPDRCQRPATSPVSRTSSST